MPRRPDAELVKTTKFHELEFHIMHGRNESAIYFNTQIDLTKTLEFLEKYNKGKKENETIMATKSNTLRLCYKEGKN